MTAREFFGDDGRVRVIVDTPEWLNLQLAPDLELKDKVTGFFKTHLHGLVEGLSEAIVLAIDELLGNAMEHGCQLDPSRCVQCGFVRTNRLIIVQITDEGPGFAWESLDHAALSNPPDEPLRHVELRSQRGLRPGGFGIMLTRQVADTLLYNESGNRVLFIKHLD